MRDFQRGKVYGWERQYVAPITSLMIPFEKAKMFVDGIWLSMGLVGAPDVGLLPKNATATWADGCRDAIRVQETTPAWVIIHELAHALASEFDGNSDMHGPDFVGIYIKLLDKVLNIPVPMLMYSLTKEGVKYNLAAQPRFVKGNVI